MLAIPVPGSSTYGSSGRGVALEKMSRSVCCEKKGLAGRYSRARLGRQARIQDGSHGEFPPRIVRIKESGELLSVYY